MVKKYKVPPTTTYNQLISMRVRRANQPIGEELGNIWGLSPATTYIALIDLIQILESAYQSSLKQWHWCQNRDRGCQNFDARMMCHICFHAAEGGYALLPFNGDLYVAE